MQEAKTQIEKDFSTRIDLKRNKERDQYLDRISEDHGLTSEDVQKIFVRSNHTIGKNTLDQKRKMKTVPNLSLYSIFPNIVKILDYIQEFQNSKNMTK